MIFMLQMYADPAGWDEAMAAFSAEDAQRMVGFMKQVDVDLAAAGELVEERGFDGPAKARTVRAGADGGGPEVTAGLIDPAGRFLVGYWVVDVASSERAIEIAAHISAAPGPGGRPMRMPIEIHPAGSPPV